MAAHPEVRCDRPRHRRQQPAALLAHARGLVEAPLAAPAHQLGARLAAAIEAAFGNEEPLDILGFSMGGVIARTWIQRMGGHARTRRFISLGSPQQGTLTAQPWPRQLLAGIADLNGDGQYDFVIKQPGDNIDPYRLYWTPSPDTYKIEAYLHDGRARTLEEAILWHDGEGRAARDAFRTMPAADRAALVAFLRSL